MRTVELQFCPQNGECAKFRWVPQPPLNVRGSESSTDWRPMIADACLQRVAVCGERTGTKALTGDRDVPACRNKEHWLLSS